MRIALNTIVKKLNTTIEDMKVDIMHLKRHSAENSDSFTSSEQQNRAAFTQVFAPAVPRNVVNQLVQTENREGQYFTYSPNQ